jgi:integrase/recombinase XerD
MKFTKNGFSQMAEKYIRSLRRENRYSTAHVYENAINSFARFCNTDQLSFGHITRRNLRQYAQYLERKTLKPNSISTYIRMLRSIYYQGVDAGKVAYMHNLFHDVFTGVDTPQKRSIPIEQLHQLLYAPVDTEELRKTQIKASLLFQLCGMPFADLAHLEKNNLQGNVLKYNRKKTKTPITVEVLPTAQLSFALVERHKKSHRREQNYLFNILSGKKTGEAAYIEYQNALRLFNRHLQKLADTLHIELHITSYCMRHSFATMLKYRKVPIEMISELLGHKSIKTTQIYLKSFALKERTEVNKKNYLFLKNYTTNAKENTCSEMQLLNR